MLIQGNYLKKEKVVICKETDTMEEVLNLLYDSGFRCIPVLDKNGEKYLGNVYKVNILEKEKEERKNLVTEVLKDPSTSIGEERSYEDIFPNIKIYPYLAVVNKKGHFLGILPHSYILSFTEDMYELKPGEVGLTLVTNDIKGRLFKILKIIDKYAELKNLSTRDGEDRNLRRIWVTLKKGASEEAVDRIKKALDRIGVRITDVRTKEEK
jgi:hypothetical protein